MRLTFRPIKVWPDRWQDPHRDRSASPFTSTYAATLKLLEAELRHLGAEEAVAQVAVREQDCRLDGQLRADAKPSHPGVILTVEAAGHGTLVYACDRFESAYYRSRDQASWQVNLRAIALGLEALRKVARYGIAERGQQYAGYRELGAGVPLGPAKMPAEEAARFLIDHGEPGGTPAAVEDILAAAADTTGPGPGVIADYFRHAAKRLHPDAGGDPDIFRRLMEAKAVLAPRES